MKGYRPPRMIRLVPGLAIPEYMGFLLEYCVPIGSVVLSNKSN